jgi:atypical dual specificity phosphatase
MTRPNGFSWVNRPLLAALARPASAEDLVWLRDQGIDLIISLTEEPLPRHWINDAGLMVVHVPIEDMEAPTPEQLDHCVNTIERANAAKLGVAVHCTAGLGRTGTVLAGYFVSQGDDARRAIDRIRQLRPRSIETPQQAQAVEAYAKRRAASR